MKAPPENISPRWAIFFVGVFFGAVISWLFFIYNYGITEEQQVRNIVKMQKEIDDLNRHHALLSENQERLNKENKKNLTIQEIKIQITNTYQYKLNKFTALLLENDVKNDLSHLITQDIRSVAMNKELLRRAIENKVYEKDDKRYKLEIQTIYFDTVLEITLKIRTVS
ncbi:molybdenum cofactor biosynthesis protein MoaA [Bacillus sp. RG28]|uniref:Molybdenum cofactor biosynthesis protein MoaA n=1 Tax=Gottfriedia endophytica TaxID=2820819 RepID=A0A940SJB5_9BACI|nr:sporulation membrane protein YtrI [Gottfriedia endophytica]MBP0724053.1 molybdenum cofactor biosynthesis protein MoaA [Gottfriedia endophytica]